jgi:hypothetical protein
MATMETKPVISRPPLALFVYNRPNHVRQTLDSLALCVGSGDTDLHIFSDGPRMSADIEKVNQVRALICAEGRFGSLTIHERESNAGLAASIISGVNALFESHNEVIVLEDDILVSPQFLEYMRLALENYRYVDRVWHISGWSYPIDLNWYEESAFFCQVMNCWGWATWKNRWQHFERDTTRLLKEFTRAEIARFDYDSAHPFFSQIRANARGSISTWAVFWYATIYRRGGLCLNPRVSLTENIGFDGSGVHCGDLDPFKGGVSSLPQPFRFPSSGGENLVIREQIKRFYRDEYPGLLSRAFRRFVALFRN